MGGKWLLRSMPAAAAALVCAMPAAAKGTGWVSRPSEKDHAITVPDGFKGARLSSRFWNQQLRQRVCVVHGEIGGGISDITPFEGFLHQNNALGTLGTDEKESPYRLKDPLAMGGSRG